MSDPIPAMRSIVVERILPHPPEKIWRALTQSSLIAEWLMENDFEPRAGAAFTLRGQPIGNWDGTVSCEVTAFHPPSRLAYRWQGGTTPNAPHGSALDSVVEWTLTPVPGGTRVRMEHSGFRPQNDSAFSTLSGGWPKILARLEKVTSERS